MKNKQKDSFAKKIVNGLLLFILVVTAVCIMETDVKHVFAADNGSVVKLEDTKIDYRVKKYSNISEYRIKDDNGQFMAPTLTADELSDAGYTASGEWLFAGWYTNEKCTSPLSSTVVCEKGKTMSDGDYYAKFVSADVTNVKCQITSGTKSTDARTVLRCVSSVDSLKYKSIGFELVTPSGTKYMESNKVGTRIKAKEGTDEYSYSPKVVDTESEYFYSAVETIEKANFSYGYIVKPYWVTQDGTKVYGVNRYVTVMEGVADKANTTIHVSVKKDNKPTGTFTVEGGNATSVALIKYESGYAHFAITVADRNALQSATKFVIKASGSEIATYIYRNLNTKITDVANAVPTGDQSWYTAFSSEDDEFVIATNADFYGLAEIVNKKTDLFSNKTVYLVSDIKTNKGYADPVNLRWTAQYAEDGITSIQDGTTNVWTKIGSESNRFAGTFDGQMHSISGIYMNTGSSYIGLFGGTDSTAKIKNFRLLNSFFYAGGEQLGSIVGNAMGEFDTIYSDAVLKCTKGSCGGVIGSTSSGGGVTMTNCWFAGSVASNTTTKASYYAGLVGQVQAASTISNCLNTGTVTNDSGAGTPGVGGMVGYAKKSLTLSHCFNKGTISPTGNYSGLLVGRTDVLDSMTDCYSISQSGKSLAYGKEDSTYPTCQVIKTEDSIKGTKALTEMTSLFSTETSNGIKSYWAILPEEGPALSSFADAVKGTAQAVDISWYHSSKLTYTLSDMADFYGFAMLSKSNTFEGKTIQLSKDIATKNEGNAKDWATAAPDYEWIGIGRSDSAFAGTFDGQMHNIDGIYMKTSATYGGLFCVTAAENVIIKNFSLTNSYFYSTKDQLGSIAGQGNGTFDTIYSDAIVESTNKQVGGLIGRVAAKSTMNNCWFNGTVSAEGESVQKVGGLVGETAANTLTNCLNSGSITATGNDSPYVGGLVGHGNTSALYISYSMNTGAIGHNETATGYYGLIAGGYATYASTPSRISNTYTTAQEDEPYVQGASNDTYTLDSTLIQGTDALMKMQPLFTYKKDNNYNNYWAIVLKKAPVLSTFAAYAEDSYQIVDTSWMADAAGTSADPYLIADEADFYGLSILSKVTAVGGFSGKTIKLTADIEIKNQGTAEEWETTAPDYEWPGIGTTNLRFAGIFDGDGKTISGIYMNTSDQYTGLFGGTASTAQIKNFYLKESYFYSTNQQLGSIVGNAMGTFDKIYTNARLKGTANMVGGMIGATSSGGGVTMTDCWFDGTVTNAAGSSRYGGFIGRIWNTSTFTDCLNTGTIDFTNNTGTTIYVGGFAGIIHQTDNTEASEFSNCLNLGEVKVNSGKRTYGAIYGSAETDVIVDSTYSYTYESVPLLGSTARATSTHSSLAGTKEELKGYNALVQMPYLFASTEDGDKYESSWAIAQDKTPMLKHFAGEELAVDMSWYSGAKDKYEISNTAQLYGLALLSKLEEIDGFSGKTITMTKNIAIDNTGEAKNWGTKAPNYEWIGIGTDSTYFKGTFDGGLHTISGVYYTNDKSVGLFVATDEGSTVQKLRLENSYFEASGIRCGSIAATGKGNFYMIYSDATVIGYGDYVGGFVGITASEVVMENCWFAGNVTNASTSKQYTGGLVGRVNGGKVTLKNCLNSGTVSSSYNVVNGNNQIVIAVGGMVGSVGSEAQLEVGSSLNIGKIEHYTISGTTDTKIRGYGPIVGYSNNLAAAVIYSTYATTESCSETDKSNITASFETVSESSIKGNNAKTAMPLLSWDDWKCVSGQFPQIIFSASGFGDGSDNTATSSDKSKLSSIYSGRTLYQGEAHDHANNGGASDGATKLATWKTQMQNNDMDFAASLDHRQTWHIKHAEWDQNKLIYGTEAAVWISDLKDSQFHYDMVFTGQSALQSVLKSFNKFNYNANKDNSSSSSGAFDYATLTKKEFINLINKVKEQGGFFALAHPTLYYPTEDNVADIADNVLDYYFADGIGMHVIYRNLTTGYTKANYELWTELLAKGKRIWACSAGDGHKDLSTGALTSIYAKKNTGENYLSEAYVRNMKVGAFTAGSVGIQMCINNTQMGGSCDFNGQRLVVGIPQGAFHSSVLVTDNKYRVEILNEDGVVYSREISNDSDTYLAFDADENSDFYRVEVYNATSGLRIAIGNPIWND